MNAATVEFAGIELQSPCPHCSAPMAVNALVDRCRCSSCLTDSVLPPSAWEEALRGVERDVVQFAEGYLRHGPEWDEGGPPPGPHVSWLRGHDAPPCPRCQRAMRLSPQGGCVCPACGAGRAILPRPAWLPADSPVLGFVSDEPAVAQERPREPVHVACTQCGAPLLADGSSRIVPCGYCAARVMLPDAVWAALHPPRVKSRWWVVVRVAKDPRRAPAEVARFSRMTRRIGPVATLFAVPSFFAAGLAAMETSRDPWGASIGTVVAIYSVPLIVWLWGRWRYWRICRPEYEVVGRLCHPLGERRAQVVLTPPHRPTVVMARAELRLDDDLDHNQNRFAELGGAGGKIRAWMVHGNPKLVHSEPTPSALE